MSVHRLAIVFFSRKPQQEALAKRWVAQTKQNFRVAQGLIQKTWHIVQQTGLPAYWIDDTQQPEHTFGERLAAAMKVFFELGFSKVLLVGNDCPALTSAHLLRAAEQLQTNDWVIGPDQHGGVYLLGVSVNCFDYHCLSQVNWQSDRVFSELTQISGASCQLLNVQADLNDCAALEQLRQSTNNLHRWLLVLIKQPRLIAQQNPLFHLFVAAQVRLSLPAPPPFSL